MKEPMTLSQDIFYTLIDAEVEEKDPDHDFLTESREGEFSENAKAVAEVAMSDDYIEEDGRVQEAVVAAVNRLRYFEVNNGEQAAREAGFADGANDVTEASCDDVAYWKRVAVWMADAHAANLPALLRSSTSESERDSLKTLTFECLSALRGGLVENTYRRDTYEVIQRLKESASTIDVDEE